MALRTFRWRAFGLGVSVTAAVFAAGAITPARAQPALTPDQPQAIAKCVDCHEFTKAAPPSPGPNLHGVVGRKAGSNDAAFPYSDAMKGSGVTWTAESLQAYITHPSAVVSGTKMSFEGEPDPGNVKAIIDYLTTLKD